MTTETRQRIRAYKRMLPDLRERVIAVALLLAMSASMLGSASFAWLTLSRAPEVSGMSTTVAANGNLEIALAQGSISDPLNPPEESAVGDSSAAEEQTIVGANATWGNLVNVSDPSYGVSSIALRPALLSDYNRKDYPLNGATYGGDGRVVTTNERYEYASYEKVPGQEDYYFAAGADANGKSLVNYGVRAITSVGYVNLTSNNRLTQYRTDTYDLYNAVHLYYKDLVDTEANDVNTLNVQKKVTCITALEGLVTVFAQDRVNQMLGNNSNTSCSPHLWYLYQMLLKLEKVLADEGIALLELVNWQAYVASGDDKIENKVPSVDALLAMTDAQLKDPSLGLSEETITTIKGYKSDVDDLRLCIRGGSDNGKKYNNLEAMAMECSNPDAPAVDYYWSSIANNVSLLVDIDTATLAGEKLSDINMGNIGKIAGGGDVVVYAGLLQNIENRLISQDCRVHADVKVKVNNIPLFGSVSIKGTVYTDAGKKGAAPTYSKAYEDATGLESTAKGEATAKDTYGMALDVWLRTNYPNAVLTLEGAAKYSEEPANITIKEDGKETTYRLHTITVSDATIDVYQKDGTWYYANTHSEVPAEDLGQQIPKEKFNKVVSGYEGENRVWEDWREMLDGGYIEQDATTQGAGSCFVFYADSPVEQEKIKEMLQSFNVAFVDQNGDTLGTAKLNLETAYANQGKVTVPLEMETGDEYVDESGAVHTGITTLTQNEPLFITAIIYLNGSKLQNENVLAKGELQGQLNIQFGTSVPLVAPKNEELAAQARTITATVTVNGESTTNGTIGGTEGLEYRESGYPTTVTLAIEGEQPERITGFFVRVINETQGTRGEEINFTRNENGTWTGAFTKDENDAWTKPLKLTNPGTYAFDTLIVDGVQYTLHDGTVKKTQDEYYPANRPKVHIKGLALTSVSIEEAPGTYMTADTSKTLTVTAVVDSAIETKQVNAQFFSADKKKQYTAILSRVGNTNSWKGTVDIGSSGTYTLDYVTADGYSLPAPSTGQYELYLGLTANVSTPLTRENWEFFFIGATQIEMEVRIYDDGGQPIENLSNVELYYNNVLSPAGLTWKVGQYGGYYGGAFEILQPGEMTFRKIELGQAGTIRNVNDDSPRFLAISLATPSYVNGEASTTQTVIADGSKATMKAVLNAAETAQNVYAEIQKPDGTSMFIKANETSGNARTFTLPKVDGMYTMKRIYMQTVYDKDWVNAAGEVEGKWYANTNAVPTGATDDTFFILEAVDAPTTEVIATYQIELYYDSNGDGIFADSEKKTSDFTVNLSGTVNNPTGTLLQGYRHNDLKVTVTDYKGRAITGVNGTAENSSTKMVIAYDNTTDTTYGSYDGAPAASINVPMVLSEDKTYLTLADADTGTEGFQGTSLIHSGKYTATITVNMAGNNTTMNVHPIFTIATMKPMVTVSSVSSTSSISVYSGSRGTDGTVDNATRISGSFNKKLDNHNAVVYIYSGGNDGYTVTLPIVKLKLSGIVDSGFTATMTFANAASSNHAATFEFMANNQESEAEIGHKENGQGTSLFNWTEKEPKIFPAGEDTVKTITVTYNNVPLTVELSDDVTINQPQYPPCVEISTNETQYSGAKIIYSEDGKHVVMPTTVTWDEIHKEADNSGLVEDVTGLTPTKTNTYKYAYCHDTSGLRKWWHTYTVSEKVYETQAIGSEWTVRRTVTGWQNNGKSYGLGERIPVTGKLVLTPIVSTSGRLNETTVNTSMIRYVVTNDDIVQGDDKSSFSTSSAPSGFTRVTAIPTPSDTGWKIK